MKILLLGGDGQLGRDCHALLNPDHSLIVPHYTELDLRMEQDLKSCINQEQPEVIINCAAYTAVDDCENNQELALQINGHAPRYLAQAAEQMDARLIHISTDYVFSGNKPVPQSYTEDDSVDPLSQYGKSKLAGELAVQEFCSNYLILRTAWLYSAHGPNFLKTMLRLTAREPKRQFKVVNDQYGSLTWSYTLAAQIKVLLDRKVTGIMHTTSDGYSSWYEAACYFLDKMAVAYNITPCTTEEYPTPAKRPANSILANTILDEANLSTFNHWKQDIDIFVERFREDLMQEALEG